MTSALAKLVLSAAGIAFLLATPAEAAKLKHGAKAASKHVRIKQRAVAPDDRNTVTFSVHTLGRDPDPHIRHQLRRDISGYFGGDI